MTAPLEGIRVLDLSENVAGPFCAKLLADFGAQVTKIERPRRGDPARLEGPFFQDDPHPEKSALFLHLNTNKRSVTLDLETEEGRGICKRLAAQVDAVIESFRPGTLEALGLGYEVLEAVNPALILTSISDFGQSGPYRDLHGAEIVLSAMGGPLLITGTRENEPLKLGGNVVQYHAGSAAAYATMLGLLSSELDEEGQHIDVAIYETQAGFRDRRVIYLTSYSYTGDTSKRPLTGRGLGSGVKPCADGYVNVLGGARWFPLVCDMIGHPELANDPRFQRAGWAAVRPEAAEEFDEYYLPWLMERDKRTIVAEAQARHMLSAPIFTVQDLLEDPHYQQRGAFEEVDHPETGPRLYPGRPFIMSDSPRPPARRAPLLGEHTAEVLCGELGYSEADLERLRQQGVV